MPNGRGAITVAGLDYVVSLLVVGLAWFVLLLRCIHHLPYRFLRVVHGYAVRTSFAVQYHAAVLPAAKTPPRCWFDCTVLLLYAPFLCGLISGCWFI